MLNNTIVILPFTSQKYELNLNDMLSNGQRSSKFFLTVKLQAVSFLNLHIPGDQTQAPYRPILHVQTSEKAETFGKRIYLENTFKSDSPML